MQLSQERKDEVLKAIAELIIAGLKDGSIVEDDLFPIANFVLEKIDTLATEEQMVVFLSELAQKWPVFSKIYSHEKGKVLEHTENLAAQNVMDLAKEGKIDEAVDLAKSVTAPEVPVVAEVPQIQQ
ncbi:hypothetical protein KJ980_01655 [Patescibacteria group bacterium]|nr:hypothetical protein [Patescibacteria group bacterium]MBU4098333.1 hypothetical protein [Patescibacteria group bacterium]